MQFLNIFSQRVFYGLVLLVCVLIINFFLLHLAPGDIVDTIAGDMGGADEKLMAEIRAAYGLDRPLLEQLGIYLYKVAQFDMGFSLFFNRPVTELILDRLPATLLLVISSQIVAIILGTFLGVMAARNPNGFFSHVLTFFFAAVLCSASILDRDFVFNFICVLSAAVPGRRHA